MEAESPEGADYGRSGTGYFSMVNSPPASSAHGEEPQDGTAVVHFVLKFLFLFSQPAQKHDSFIDA